MSETTRGRKQEEVPVVVPSPARQVVRAYRSELSVVAVVLAALLLAAIIASSGDQGDGPIYLTSPRDDVQEIDPSASQRMVQLQTRGTLGAMIPPQPQVSVVTVPVPATAAPAAPGGAFAGAGATQTTTRSTLPRYENGSQPPIVDIVRLGPQNQNTGEPVELRFRAGDGDGHIVGYVISWGDGQKSGDAFDPRCGPPPGEPDHEFPAQRHTYREIGTYEVEVLVYSKGTCDAGPTQRASDKAEIQIGPPIPSLGL